MTTIRAKTIVAFELIHICVWAFVVASLALILRKRAGGVLNAENTSLVVRLGATLFAHSVCAGAVSFLGWSSRRLWFAPTLATVAVGWTLTSFVVFGDLIAGETVWILIMLTAVSGLPVILAQRFVCRNGTAN